MAVDKLKNSTGRLTNRHCQLPSEPNARAQSWTSCTAQDQSPGANFLTTLIRLDTFTNRLYLVRDVKFNPIAQFTQA